MKNTKKTLKKKLIKDLKAVARELHFESGGSPSEWRGSHSVHKNKSDKRQDRSTKIKKAIKDSEE